MPDFPYNPKDVQWVGGLIDALVWDGCSEDEEITVVALEYKSGTLRLKDDQKRVRDAINVGRFRYEILPLPPFVEPEPRFEVVARPARKPRVSPAPEPEPGDSVIDWEEWKKAH